MRQLSLKSWQAGRPNNNNNNLIAAPCPFSQHKKVNQQLLSELPGRTGTHRPGVTPKFNFCLVNHAVWPTFLSDLEHTATGNFCHQEEGDYLSTSEIAEPVMAITYKLLIRWYFQLTRINLLATVSRPQCLPALQPMEAVLSLFLVRTVPKFTWTRISAFYYLQLTSIIIICLSISQMGDIFVFLI